MLDKAPNITTIPANKVNFIHINQPHTNNTAPIYYNLHYYTKNHNTYKLS